MKTLVLLGGGHAHVHVLKTFAAAPPANTNIVLITPHLRQVYSGMLPGWIAGHYVLEDCVIPLQPLANAANARVIQTWCDSIDFNKQQIICRNGQHVPFDFLSIDTGSVANMSSIETASIEGTEKIIAIRPIEHFIDHMTNLRNTVRARHQRGEKTRIAVIGAGAGGIEVALALQHATRDDAALVTLISAANAMPNKLALRIDRALARAQINVVAGNAATKVDAREITLVNGKTIAADFIIAALGAKAATWPQHAGLACDAQGYILTNNKLQSISHANVFAVGDCASIESMPRPKSGVYAVRAGPPLADNLRSALTLAPLKPYTPQARALHLISTGDKYAIGAWGNFAWEGRWVWRWKDRIDRAFIEKYRR